MGSTLWRKTITHFMRKMQKSVLEYIKNKEKKTINLTIPSFFDQLEIMFRTRKITDYRLAVLTTMLMRLSREQAIAYLRVKGYDISLGTLGRMKADIRKGSRQELYDIAKHEFPEQHLERIRNCELIQRLMWEQFHLEPNH